MTFTIPRRGMAALLAPTFALSAGGAFAQGSDKPLRMVLPVGAGSGVDTIMRAAAASFTKALGGQGGVIGNLPRAGGRLSHPNRPSRRRTVAASARSESGRA